MVIQKDITLVVFDFDGTLFQLDIDWPNLKNKLSSSGNSTQNLGELLQRAKENQNAEVLDIVTQAEYEAAKGQRLDSKICATLATLQGNGINLAIFTRNSSQVVEETLKGTTLEDKIKIVGREDVRYLKPDPEGLVALMKEFGADQSATILVGDTSHDVIAARNAGTKVIIVENSFNDFIPEGADYYIKAIPELVTA